jgi:RNA polymerase sigma-70 factor (ECF subfamily)
MNTEVAEKIDNVELTNQELILRAKTGDESSIAKLCEFNRKYIYNVLIVRTRGNRELSEDLTQDILIRIISNLDKYENTGYKFRSWVSKVIKSTHIDHVRKEKCRIESYATSVDFTEAGGEDDFKTNVLDYNVLSHVSVEQDFIKAEASARMKEIIQEGIESLGNASQKRAIVLNLFEDLSYNEISEKLGVSLDVTKSLIYRAKQGILKNIVANNYHMAGSIVNQMIIQESVLNGTSSKSLAKRFEIGVDEVDEILEGSLKKVYRYKFYGDGVKESVAV